MTDDQSNQLDMLLVLKDFYTANQAAIDVVPILALNFPKIATNIAVINSNLAGQSANIKGVTQTKANLRINLNLLTFNILSIAGAWAVAENDPTLSQEFYVTESGLEKIKDDTIAAYCIHRYNLVNDNLVAMASYGISAATMTTWQDAITDYENAVAAPREAINTRSTHTGNLKTVFDDTMKLLKENIDPVMLNFKTSDPELYNGYTKARIIIDRGGQSGTNPTPIQDSITLKGSVTDANTAMPLSAASVTVYPSDGSAPISTITNPEGKYEMTFNNVPLNVTFSATLEAQLNGYGPSTKSIIAMAGESLIFDFALVPIIIP